MRKNKIKNEFQDKYENIKLIVENSVQSIKKDDSAFLDAGGGKKSVIEFNNYKKSILDISEKQLSLNNNDAIFIQADLEEFNETNKYDIVLCYDVIEHLKNPKKAIDNMLNSLVNGGVLILGAPNPVSFWGIFTKFTPYVVHRLFYKYILGSNNANKETGPFETYLKLFIRPKNIKNNYVNERYTIISYDVFEGYLQRLVSSRFILFKFFLNILKLINKNLILSNYIIVIKKIH